MPERIYVVFTSEGFAQAKPELTDSKSMLWYNPGVLSDEEQQHLVSLNISCQLLTPASKPNDDKAIHTALTNIESKHPTAEILVEYL